MIYLGDIHGNFNVVHNFILKFDIKDETIIQVGDLGLGFDTEKKDLETLNHLQVLCIERNIKFLAIRGNHDNPLWFTEESPWQNKCEFGIFLIPDYTIIDNILFVGGAISVDRGNRKYNELKFGEVGWWENEKFILDETKLKEIRNINIVVTHSVPMFVSAFGIPQFIYDLAARYEDKTLVDECIQERNDLKTMYEILIENNEITDWLHGHFHRSNLENYNGCDFRCLDINEFYERG